MRAVAFAVLLCAAFPGPAHAGIWERLGGRWTGQGEVSGLPAQVDLAFRSALGGRAYHLRFDNRMTAAHGKVRAFQAEAIYLCDGAVCHGHWYDNRGQILPLRANAEADRVVVEWGDTGTERGRTTYRLDADGRLGIHDEVVGKDGVWKPFGRVVAVRAGTGSDAVP